MKSEVERTEGPAGAVFYCLFAWVNAMTRMIPITRMTTMAPAKIHLLALLLFLENALLAVSKPPCADLVRARSGSRRAA